MIIAFMAQPGPGRVRAYNCNSSPLLLLLPVLPLLPVPLLLPLLLLLPVLQLWQN